VKPDWRMPDQALPPDFRGGATRGRTDTARPDQRPRRAPGWRPQMRTARLAPARRPPPLGLFPGALCRRDAGTKRPWSAEGATGTWEVEGDDAPDANASREWTAMPIHTRERPNPPTSPRRKPGPIAKRDIAPPDQQPGTIAAGACPARNVFPTLRDGSRLSPGRGERASHPPPLSPRKRGPRSCGREPASPERPPLQGSARCLSPEPRSVGQSLGPRFRGGSGEGAIHRAGSKRVAIPAKAERNRPLRKRDRPPAFPAEAGTQVLRPGTSLAGDAPIRAETPLPQRATPANPLAKQRGTAKKSRVYRA
jgi:hypothetical protein